MLLQHLLKLKGNKGFPGGSVVKNPPAMQETQETGVQSLGWEDPLGEDMATHSSIFAWTEEPGGLQTLGLQRVRHNLSDWARMPGIQRPGLGREHRQGEGVPCPGSPGICRKGRLGVRSPKASGPLDRSREGAAASTSHAGRSPVPCAL